MVLHNVFHKHTETYTTNTLLPDTVEICGGSRKLLKILNQFGAVTSPDTHDCFVTDVATCQSVRDDLSDVVYTLASIDNFDYFFNKFDNYFF